MSNHQKMKQLEAMARDGEFSNMGELAGATYDIDCDSYFVFDLVNKYCKSRNLYGPNS